ncbi:hypothetical protein NDU88_006567 [Pleurodeles waltl]|uniref:Uncharacterized protein n=1 Tax=Pleurodeles waltl TaxID=8319 RepID=A0AAV7X1G3_PLEWA|nr:hypothetical protein NDU88_006567 [Pleurodeles waltl]
MPMMHCVFLPEKGHQGADSVLNDKTGQIPYQPPDYDEGNERAGKVAKVRVGCCRVSSKELGQTESARAHPARAYEETRGSSSADQAESVSWAQAALGGGRTNEFLSGGHTSMYAASERSSPLWEKKRLLMVLRPPPETAPRLCVGSEVAPEIPLVAKIMLDSPQNCHTR